MPDHVRPDESVVARLQLIVKRAKHRRYNGHPSYMPHDKFEDCQIGLAVVDKHVRVSKKHGRCSRHLNRPLARLPPHLVPAEAQYLSGAPERNTFLFQRSSHESRQAVFNEVVFGETRRFT